MDPKLKIYEDILRQCQQNTLWVLLDAFQYTIIASSWKWLQKVSKKMDKMWEIVIHV